MHVFLQAIFQLGGTHDLDLGAGIEEFRKPDDISAPAILGRITNQTLKATFNQCAAKSLGKSFIAPLIDFAPILGKQVIFAGPREVILD